MKRLVPTSVVLYSASRSLSFWRSVSSVVIARCISTTGAIAGAAVALGFTRSLGFAVPVATPRRFNAGPIVSPAFSILVMPSKSPLAAGAMASPNLALKFSQVVVSLTILSAAVSTAVPILPISSAAISPTACATSAMLCASMATPPNFSLRRTADIPRLSRISGDLRPIPVTILFTR